MHEVLVNRLGGLSLPRKSVVRLTDRPDMTLDVYRGRKTTIQLQQQLRISYVGSFRFFFCRHGGESRDLNDRVHGISYRYSDKTSKRIYHTFLNTQPIFIKQSAHTA